MRQNPSFAMTDVDERVADAVVAGREATDSPDANARLASEVRRAHDALRMPRGEA